MKKGKVSNLYDNQSRDKGNHKADKGKVGSTTRCGFNVLVRNKHENGRSNSDETNLPDHRFKFNELFSK